MGTPVDAIREENPVLQLEISGKTFLFKKMSAYYVIKFGDAREELLKYDLGEIPHKVEMSLYKVMIEILENTITSEHKLEFMEYLKSWSFSELLEKYNSLLVYTPVSNDPDEK